MKPITWTEIAMLKRESTLSDPRPLSDAAAVPRGGMWRRRDFAVTGVLGLGAIWLDGCTSPAAAPAARSATPAAENAALRPERLAALDRLTWGGNAATLAHVSARGWTAWLEEQLRSDTAILAAPVQAQIDALPTLKGPLTDRVYELEALRRSGDGAPAAASSAGAPDASAKQAARQAYQQALQQHAHDAMARHILRGE